MVAPIAWGDDVRGVQHPDAAVEEVEGEGPPAVEVDVDPEGVLDVAGDRRLADVPVAVDARVHEDADVGRGDAAAGALLAHVVHQARAAEPEDRVPGELRLGHAGNDCPFLRVRHFQRLEAAPRSP